MKRLSTLFCILSLLLCCEKPSTGLIIEPPKPNPNQNQNQNQNQDPNQNSETPPAAAPAGPIIVGYAYTDSGALPDPSLLTHINFSFAKIQDDFETLYIRDKKVTRLKQIVALKKQKPELKVLLGAMYWEIGGDDENQTLAKAIASRLIGLTSQQTEDPDDDGNRVYKHTRNNYSYPSIRKTIFNLTDSGSYQERIVKYLLQIGVAQKDIDDLRAIMLQ